MVKTSCSDMQRSLRWDEDHEDAKTVTYGSKKQVSLAGQRGRSGGKSNREKCSSSHEKVDPRQKIFTPQEEDLVIQLHSAIGSRWPIIAQQLPGRTDNDVKVLWNSKLRKKLSAMGIDPVTHKPFSQILADYGNIGAFPKARTRFTSLSKDLKNAATIIFKPEQQSHHQKNPQSFIANHFPTPPKQEFADHHPNIDLYSQLQAVNFITEASNYTEIESLTTGEYSPSTLAANQEISSFSWSDFFLEDAFSGQEYGDGGQENGGKFVQRDDDGEIIEGKGKSCEVEGTKKHDGGLEGSSSSNSYSFVDAMIDGQDAMFTQLPCFSDQEPFYY